MSDKLKLCPFCGENAKHEEWYINGRYETHMIQCPCCGIMTPPADKQDPVLSAWNRRTPDQFPDVKKMVVPEPMTSVVKWVRYDGTPETLPELGAFCVGRFYYASHAPIAQAVETQWNGCGLAWQWWTGFEWGINSIEIGDLWAPLPTPPEGME